MSILELIESRTSEAVVESMSQSASISKSRNLAVSRVFQGGVLVAGALSLGGLVGVGLFGAAAFGVATGATLLGGFGLIQLGRAATHLRRYGSTHALVGFDAAAGLGLSVTGFAALYWLYISGLVPGWITGTVFLLGVEFGVLLLLLVLRTLLRWATHP